MWKVVVLVCGEGRKQSDSERWLAGTGQSVVTKRGILLSLGYVFKEAGGTGLEVSPEAR